MKGKIRLDSGAMNEPSSFSVADLVSSAGQPIPCNLNVSGKGRNKEQISLVTMLKKPSNCRFLARYNLPFARTWCSMLAASLSEILIDNTFLPFARLGNCQSTKALFIFALCFHPRFGNCILGKSSILVGVLKSQVEIQGSKKVNLHPVECA